MDPLSSINTSLYTDLVNYPAVPVKTSMAPIDPVKQEFEQDNSYNFNNYYSDVEYDDPLSIAGSGVLKTSEELGEAMISALENGFSVQDACNIKLAQIAYQASCTVFKSTFELKI